MKSEISFIKIFMYEHVYYHSLTDRSCCPVYRLPLLLQKVPEAAAAVEPIWRGSYQAEMETWAAAYMLGKQLSQPLIYLEPLRFRKGSFLWG